MDFSRVLSESEVERIHLAAEDVLAETGFKVMDGAAVAQCAAAGAKVNETTGVVRLDKLLLRELLARVPSTYTIAGVDGQTREVGGEQHWGLAIVTDPWIIDYETRRPRKPRLEDLRRHAIIGQQMGHVAAMSRMDMPVSDVEGAASSLRAWEQYLLQTGKHHHFMPASSESIHQWLDIVRILSRGEDPRTQQLFSMAAAVISPLSISRENVEAMRLACEYNAAIIPTVCPMAGSTGPYTLASTLLLGHAEVIFVAALTQILKPANPFLYAQGPSIMDMRSGHDLYYTLDKVLWKIAAVQLAKYCSLPVSAECGGTMTYRYDPQNGMEGSLFMLAAVASGACMLSGFGSCYTAMGMSAEMMVIQEAWMASAQFLQRGMCTDDLHLGVETIKRAGPRGEFMADELTLKYMRGGEFFAHELFDRSAESEEGKSMLHRAHEKVEQLVTDFESPVPQDVQEKLRRYFHDECAKL